MSQSGYVYSIGLILSCSILFMMAATSFATFTLPNESSLSAPLFGFDPAAEKCLSSVHGVEGCVQEIITAFFSFKIEFLGSACCKAFIEIEDQCWPKVFPLNPFFPPLIKLHCERILSNAPRSPTTNVQQHAPVSSPKIEQGTSPPSTTVVPREPQSPPSTEQSPGQDESQLPPSEE